MNTESRKINIRLDEEFPFIINDTLGISKNSNMLHWHDCFEICRLKQGTGTYMIGGRKYNFSKGDIFIISSNEIHFAYNDRNVIMQVLLFDPKLLCNGTGYTFELEYLLPFWESAKRKQHKITKSDNYYDDIISILSQMEDEYKLARDGYRLVIKSLLLSLSAVLFRVYNISSKSSNASIIKERDTLKPVLQFIEHNCLKPVSLKLLADRAHMSVSNFSRVFKEAMGIPPMEYLIRCRIMKASRLLIETDMKILDIMLHCGYKNMSNFIRSFRKYTGNTPRDFRKYGR